MKDNKKRDFLIDAISGIDEDIVEQSLRKRFRLWKRRSFPQKTVLSLVALVACLGIIVTGVFAYLHFGKDPAPVPPIIDPNVPVYEGMTVENEPPTVVAYRDGIDSASRDVLHAFLPFKSFAADPDADTVPVGKGADTVPKDDAFSVFGQTYYAMPNEDIYIHIHLTNPAGYEILSFTLNGVKYSSYMFEAGSDMENLILKCNVGNVSGLQEYTIDAIKYVDGEQIKDVQMKGDKTVRVYVNGGEAPLMITATVEFNRISFQTVWQESFTGTRALTSLGIYDGDTLLHELDPAMRRIDDLPFGKRLLLKATYMDGGVERSVFHVFETPNPSTGFRQEWANGRGPITGIGSCTDTVLYINAPVEYGALEQLEHVTEVYLSSNVTYIESMAFFGSGLEKVVILDGLKEIPYHAFHSFGDLRNITIPASVTRVGDYAICTGAKGEDANAHIDIWYGGTMQQWEAIDKGDPDGMGIWISTDTYTVHCTDGEIEGTFYTQ